MYSFYNVTLGGSAVLLGLGRDFFCCWGLGGFFGYFLKNSTINIEFGTHLRKTAQSTNIEGEDNSYKRKGQQGDGESTRERLERGGQPVGGPPPGSERGRDGVSPIAGGWTLTRTASAT